MTTWNPGLGRSAASTAADPACTAANAQSRSQAWCRFAAGAVQVAAMLVTAAPTLVDRGQDRAPFPLTRGVLVARVGRDESRFVGEDDGLHPVPEVELDQYPAHVRFNRALLDHQLAGDLDVG